MAKIKPFKGIRYNQTKVNIEDVVTQPYDKITQEMQAFYYDRSPYNIVRLIRNKEEDPYTSAAKYFKDWLAKGILIEDKKPSIYPYYQEYDGKIRKGFVASLKVEDFSTGIVLPHERTFAGPKEDRLNLLRATRVHFGQIFMLYSDMTGKISSLIDIVIEKVPPLINVCERYEKEVKHKLWQISNPEIIAEIQELMAPNTLLIADGHHRYTTAINYCKEEESANYVMVTLVSMDDPGLTILPTHRALYGIKRENFIHKMAKYFEIEECLNKNDLLLKLENKLHSYGVYDGKFWLLKLKDESIIEELGEQERAYEYKALDVTVLHRIIFEHILDIPKEKLLNKECIDYIREIKEGIDGVKSGKYELFFILNPTRIEDLKKITAKQEVMPQKSTDFYPKLITGLVMYRIED